MSSTFILASGSPRRRELLASLGIEFTVIKTDTDESLHDGELPVDYVRRLSREKAAAALSRVDDVGDLTVLAADTIVVHDESILGKPADADDARRMLRSLRNRPHTVCTGLTLLRIMDGNRQQPVFELTEHTCTTVTMRDYSDNEIEAYIATGDPFDKAGSYAIQHEGFHPVERIEGSRTNVIGLPLETLQTMLDRLGEFGI